MARRISIERLHNLMKFDLKDERLTKRCSAAFQARLDKTLWGMHVLLAHDGYATCRRARLLRGSLSGPTRRETPFASDVRLTMLPRRSIANSNRPHHLLQFLPSPPPYLCVSSSETANRFPEVSRLPLRDALSGDIPVL
jgi:hypothetical protein